MAALADQDEIMFDTLKRRRVMSLAMSVSPGHIYFVVGRLLRGNDKKTGRREGI